MAWGGFAAPIAGTAIVTSWAVVNVGDLVNYLNGLLGGGTPPGGSNLVPVSNGTETAAWGQVGTDTLANLAVTNGKIANSTIDLSTKAANGSLTGTKVANHTIDGDAQLIQSSVTGNSSDSAIGPGVVHANRLVDGSMIESEVTRVFGSGTIPGTALKAGAVAANQGYTSARIVQGTYTGNGSSSGRQITTGFACKMVMVQNITADTMFTMINTSNGMRNESSIPVQFQSGFHLHASDGFVVGDGTTTANINASSYVYTAFG